MKIGELARRAGVTAKAVRYYESMGLLGARRLPNGYRDYEERDIRLVREIRDLRVLGIRVDQARPFLDCLVSGHDEGDECPDSLAAYRAAIEGFDEQITELAARRDALVALLHSADGRAEPLCNFSQFTEARASAAPSHE